MLFFKFYAYHPIIVFKCQKSPKINSKIKTNNFKYIFTFLNEYA